MSIPKSLVWSVLGFLIITICGLAWLHIDYRLEQICHKNGKLEVASLKNTEAIAQSLLRLEVLSLLPAKQLT